MPLEVANFFLAGFPLDTGFDTAATWFEKVGYQWLVLHSPGVWLIVRLFDKGVRIEKFSDIVLFVSGYLDTVLLILIGIAVLRCFRHLASKSSEQS
jgi:hypothetical protein